METKQRVVIVGAGFGGISAARALADAPVDVTIVDKHNFHTFSPLLYQVATAGLAPDDIAPNLRGIVQDDVNVEVRHGDGHRHRLRPAGGHRGRGPPAPL